MERQIIEPGFALGRLLAGYSRIGRLILAAAVCFGMSVSAIAQKKTSLLAPEIAVMRSPLGKTLQISQVTLMRTAGKPWGVMSICVNADETNMNTGFKYDQQYVSLDITFFARKGTKWVACGEYSLTDVLVGTVHYFAGHNVKSKGCVLLDFSYGKISWTRSPGAQKPKDNWVAPGGVPG